jgi:predicted DNA-binding protein
MKETAEEVATHVLVPVSVAEKLRDLSRKTRVTQSEYLREAVQDLLRKYGAANRPEPGALEDDRSNE